MIILRRKLNHVDKSKHPCCHYDAHRWVLDVSWNDVSYHVIGIKDGEEERINGEGIGVAITKHFRLGPEHLYYDGPHCFFSIGFVHFRWSLWWCLRCMPPDDPSGPGSSCKPTPLHDKVETLWNAIVKGK